MRVPAVAAVSIVLIGLVGLAGQKAPDPKLVDKGRDLFVANKCAMCHTLDGKGGSLSVALDGVGLRRNAEALRKVLEDPASQMPKDVKIKMPKFPWKDGEVDALVAYLSTVKTAPKSPGSENRPQGERVASADVR